VQLPAPMGLSSSALYISTESALPITRLSQLLRSHPVLANADLRPTLDRVFSIVTPDLESQDHILRYQVPVVIAKYGIRLIVLDSVAANYRAEFERPGAGNGQSGGANMAQRSFELVKLGQLLRDLAREHGLVVVVANQVADRFMGDSRNSPGGSFNPHPKTTNQSSALAKRETVDTHGLLPNSSLLGSAASSSGTTGSAFKFTSDSMSLDHQQRWFTGWGDEQYPSYLAAKNQKTPSLGFIWTSQISCRIALIKRPVYGRTLISDEETERGEPVLRRWRRWMKVVFAPHTASSGPGVSRAIEFEIKGEGLTAVQKNDYTIDEDEN
jgi:DNA repair protein RAD57